MSRRQFMGWAAAAAGAFGVGGAVSFAAERTSGKVGRGATKSSGPRSMPNIVYILADDMGYGDVKYLNKDGKIATPHMDRLGKSGMAFTDAHSGSAVCTPTRYGVLTGRYTWRTRLARGVLMGYSKPLIAQGRTTVASFLKSRGYVTTGIGKWHLGLGLPTTDGAEPKGDGSNVDFAKPIADGPTTLGFDSYYGISASLDMPPYVYIEDDHFTAVPNTQKTYLRKGLAAKSFTAIGVLPTLTKKAVEFIDARAKANADGEAQPFFLYMPLNAPHTPISPTKEFQGKSGLNKYGDFVMQVDDTVGQVLAALDRNGLADNTLVIMTSDNGCSPQADFPALAAKGHHPSYVFRGYKADIFEGGHRIPFLARWPGHIQPGTWCDQTICLTDLLATCADILGAKLPANAGEDSVSILPALEGKATGPLREATVHHSANGSFSIRQGKWKLELCPGSGGWSDPRPKSKAARALPPVQLYDMTADISERSNLQAEHPEVVAKLRKLLQRYVDKGRSTPGKPQKNDRDVSIDPQWLKRE